MRIREEKKNSLIKRGKHREKPLYHEDVRKIISQALPALVLSGIGTIAAGVILQEFLDYIYLIPGIFVLIPALMNLKGAIAASVAARLGTSYHLGFLKKQGFVQEIKENFIGAILLGVLLSISCAFFAYFVSNALGLKSISLFAFLLVSVSSGLIGVTALVLVTFFLVYLSIKLGADPNNLTFPLISTIGDFAMVGIVYSITILLIKAIQV